MNPVATQYSVAPFFVLRAPLLPVAVAERVMAMDSHPDATRAPSEGGAAASVAEEVIDELLNRPEALEGLDVAAPEFLTFLLRLQAGEGGAAGRQVDERRRERAADAARRYLLRMAYRPTPFGLFSGCTWGQTGHPTNLHVAPLSAVRKHVRLDSRAIFSMCGRLVSDAALLLALPVTPNSTLYAVGDEWRFVERHSTGEREYSFMLGAVQRSELLDRIIERSSSGPPGTALAEYVRGLGYSADDAAGFVLELVRAQVLVSALVPSVVGQDTLTRLRDLLCTYAPSTAWTEHVRALHAAIEEMNKDESLGRRECYRIAEAALATAGVQPIPGMTFQVDLHRGGPPATLSKDVTDMALAGVWALQVLTAPSARSDFLTPIKDAFLQRFGDRDVPLLHLFDPTIGFGPPVVGNPQSDAEESDAVEQLAIAMQQRRPSLTPGQQFLLRQAARVSSEGSREILLEDDDLEQVTAQGVQPLPDTFSILASLFRGRDQRGAAGLGGPIIHLRAVVGPAANLVGRFMAGEARIRTGVEALHATEQAMRPEAVLAELNFACGPRSPNVSRRPLTRGFEIPIIGPRGEAEGTAVPLADLFVRLSNGRFVLWSARLSRAVVPRMSSMHAPHPMRDLPLYAFLLALQSQDGLDYAAQEYLWGPLWKQPWLPRLRFRGAILSRETWRIFASDIAGTPTGAADRLRALLARLRVPRHVVIAEDDHELPLDLEREWAIRAILTSLRKAGSVRLDEALSAEFTSLAHGPEGGYENEVVIPCVRRELTRPVGPLLATNSPAGRGLKLHLYSTHRHPPGGEWLYLKVYVPQAVMNRVLAEIIGPACRQLVQEERVRRWFFIRYADPAEHLRVRLLCADRAAWSTVFEYVREKLDRAVEFTSLRLEIGTYEPETLRYGGPGALALTERVFHLDSELALDVIGTAAGDGIRNDDLVSNLTIVDGLLAALGFDLAGKERIASRAERVYVAAGAGAAARPMTAIVGRVHREVERKLRASFEGGAAPTAYQLWLGAIAELAPEIRNALAAERVAVFDEWVSDVLHMHCNRIFETRAREREFLAYALLARQYRGMRQRARGGLSDQES